MKGSQNDAKTYALKLLGYRARSKQEMIDRLKRKGFEDGQINAAIAYLEDAGLINDEDLASDLFTYSLEKKSLGGKGIRTFLASRGIGKPLIDKTLSALQPDMEERAALLFVEKKLRAMEQYPRDVVRRRLWGMLQRRGFSGDVIRRTVKSFKL